MEMAMAHEKAEESHKAWIHLMILKDQLSTRDWDSLRSRMNPTPQRMSPPTKFNNYTIGVIGFAPIAEPILRRWSTDSDTVNARQTRSIAIPWRMNKRLEKRTTRSNNILQRVAKLLAAMPKPSKPIYSMPNLSPIIYIKR